MPTKKLLFIFSLALLITELAAAQVTVGGTLYVAVKTAALKSGRGFFSSSIATLEYADQVTVLQVNGKYAEVRSTVYPSIRGWTELANLSARQIVTGNTATISPKEVALGGKGFDQEVEDVYRTQENLNYENVNRTEEITLNEADFLRFLEEGNLSRGD